LGALLGLLLITSKAELLVTLSAATSISSLARAVANAIVYGVMGRFLAHAAYTLLGLKAETLFL